MKSILVTGANKGIGFAVTEAVMREQPGYKVIMAARDGRRGNAARDTLLEINEAWSDRIAVLELDVASDPSVSGARDALANGSNISLPLHGLVNNAGQGTGSLDAILDVNVRGMRRVCEAFAPDMVTGARIVNVTSAAGPNFVAECDSGRRKFFLDPELSWEEMTAFMRECEEIGETNWSMMGMGSQSRYGLSKALANSYTANLARRYPQLIINACTPGFIETDLGREFLGDRTPAEAGMKAPADGAQVIMFLLFGDPVGTGHYYGSDCLRSPMDRYRAPGSPAYTGT